MTRIDARVVALVNGPVLLPDTAEIRTTAVDADGPRKRIKDGDVLFARTSVIAVRDGLPVREIDLRPTDGTFCYEIRITTTVGGFRIARYVEVPDSDEPVQLGKLPQVDPLTFQPIEDVLAAWDSVAATAGLARDESVAAAETVRARTLTAAADPNDPGVLILTYPVFMQHPDGTSILIPMEVTP